MMRSPQKADLRQRLQQMLLEKLRLKIHQITGFYSLIPLKITNLCQSQSASRIFASNCPGFPFLWQEVVTHLNFTMEKCWEYKKLQKTVAL